MRKHLLVVFAVGLVLTAGCSSTKETAAGNPAPTEQPKPTSASPSTPDCPYHGKEGYCFSPPAGTTPTPSETVADTIIFKRGAEPKAAQDIAVQAEAFRTTPDQLKSDRDFAREGSVPGQKVVEDIDIAGGQGFYVALHTSNQVIVRATVVNADMTYNCTFSAYLTDEAALKSEIDACKSLKPAN